MKGNRFASRGYANGLRGVALSLCVILGGMWASAATTAQLQAAFPGATVSGSTVTLTADIGPCVLTNTWGTVTVDLNGHSITSGVASTPAIRIDSVAKPTASTVLKLALTGTGAVVGGPGTAVTSGTATAGTGGIGIRVPDQTYKVTTYQAEPAVQITIGANVVVRGGTGGENTADGRGGTGGYGIYVSTKSSNSKPSIVNNGVVEGGAGGRGVSAGGTGGYAFYRPSYYASWITFQNNGTLRGGRGGNAGMTPGRGGSAASSTTNLTGSGARLTGEVGAVLPALCLSQQFPGAAITGDEDTGFTVTLGADVGPVTLPDALGGLTVDLNGHSITGGTTAATYNALTFKATTAPVAKPTALALTGPGRVAGASMTSAGGCGVYAPQLAAVVGLTVGEGVVIRGGDGADRLSGAGYGGGAGISSAGYVNVTNAGEIVGGDGGDGSSTGGAGGVGVSLGSGRTCVNNGVIRGGAGGDAGGGSTARGTGGTAVATGVLSGVGTTQNGPKGDYVPALHLSRQFPTATVTRDEDAGTIVTLGADLGPVVLRDDLGAVEIRLNGFTIAGRNAADSAAAGAAISFSRVAANTTPTALTLTGWGYVKGGAGADSSDPLVTGGPGGYAVYAPEEVNVRPITLQGADVQGGDGGYGPNGGGPGGAAISGTTYTGTGRVVDGARGGNGAYENFLRAFAGQTITPVAGGGYVVTLNSDLEGLVLSDAIGNLTINLNGHTIAGTAGAAGAETGGDAVTVIAANTGSSLTLTLVGPGTVRGGAGFCAEGGDMPGEGGVAIAVYDPSTALELHVGAGVLVAGGAGALGETWSSRGGDGVWMAHAGTIVNDGTIRGGDAPDAWPDPGTGGYAVNGGDALPTLTGSGTATDGADGELDPAGVFDAAFGDLPVEKDEAGGFRIVLTNDLAALTLPENLGRLTIELNGHSITGAVGTAEEPTGGDAITIVPEWGEGFGPLDLTFVGPGVVAGGAGLMGGNVDEPGLGGCGICVDGCTETSIRVGAEVTIEGGHGGDAIGRVNIESNDGGEAISVDAERFYLDNAGTICGGKGGDYVGTAKEWTERWGDARHSPTGGDGASAVHNVSGEAGLRNVGEISGGAGGFGTAQSGYGSYALCAEDSATVGATNLVDGVLAGGNGGPGGDNGGDGSAAVAAFDGCPLDLWNDGVVRGGDGGMAWPTPGSGEAWMWGDVTCAGDGVEEDGEPGLHDTLTPLHSAFPGARIRPAADGQGYVVKLLGDCGPVTLPDNMGAFTLDLNGFSITGSVTYVYAENGSLLTANSYYDYQAAFTFEPGVGDGVGATAVNVVGPGEIRGPDGAQALDLDKDAEDGQPAVRVPDDCQTVSLTLGDGVTVRGVNGGNALDPDRVGFGAVGVEGDCVVSGPGTVRPGENGVFNVSGVLRAAFPSATVEPDGAGWRVTLVKYSDPVTLGDNLGLVTIDLNGKVISSRDGSALADARPAILIEHAEGAGQGPTHLVFTGGGRVQGGNGSDATAQTAPTSGGAAVGAGAGVRAGVVVTAEAGVTLRGGDGGRRTDPGPVALGGKAVDIVLAREGAGTFIDGATGDYDATEILAACFPASASVVHVAGGGHRVTLSENVAGLVLPDNLGAVTLDLNGHAILGASGAAGTDGGAAITFHATGVAQLGPTELTLVGPGLVAGGDGVDGSSSSLPTSGGSAVCADSDDVAAVCVAAGADVTLRGGRGGNGTRPGEIGWGGKAVAAPVTHVVGSGTCLDGADGFCDLSADLAAAFGDAATITRQADGGFRVTLTADVYDLVLPENFGRITIELNGFAIRGSDATADDSPHCGLEVTEVGRTATPLDLELVGPGLVCGGNGGAYDSTGARAIYSDAFDSLTLTVGEGVTVRGGAGAPNPDSTGGDGGEAVYLDDAAGRVLIRNAGTIIGGTGGSGDSGGIGYHGIYVYGYGESLVITNLATGVIRSGDGGFGTSDGGDSYAALDLEYFEASEFVNLGLVAGGNGGAGGTSGGDTDNVVYCSSIDILDFTNTGTMIGGNGGDGGETGGSVSDALDLSGVEKIVREDTADGTIVDGRPGRAGGDVPLALAFDGSAVVTVVHGVFLVTLTNDAVAVTLPPFAGTLTIDLAGHALRGVDATASDAATPALTVSSVSDDEPLTLNLTGAGVVVGGSGLLGLDDSDGAPGIGIDGGTVAISVGADVTVRGGNGANAPRSPGRGAPAIGEGATSCTGTGSLVAGVDGTLDPLLKVTLACPEALVTTAPGGGLVLTLTNDVTGLVLPEDCGPLTLDLNGHVVRGVDGTASSLAGAALTVCAVGANETPLALSVIGPGGIVGGAGFNATRDPGVGIDGGAAIVVEDDVARATITLGAGVTVTGGAGGDSAYTVAGGVGGRGLVVPEGREGVSVTAADGAVDGHAGVYDNFRRVASQFDSYPVTVVSDGQGGSIIRLTQNLKYSLWITDDLGPITLDLNGHSIVPQGRENGIVIGRQPVGDCPTELTLLGPGLVAGGDGVDYSGSATSNSATPGVPAISVSAYAALTRLTIGADVTVRGGAGGRFATTSSSTTTMSGGAGGVGICFNYCTNSVQVVNAGTIEGGAGGTYAGRGSNGVGGAGGTGLYMSVSSKGAVTVSNTVDGVIAGGKGGVLARYDAYTVGRAAGNGGAGVQLSTSLGRRELVNEGAIQGGNGGTSVLASGTTAAGGEAVTSSGSFAVYVNSGTIANGQVGLFNKNASTWATVFKTSSSLSNPLVEWDPTNDCCVVTLNADYGAVTVPDNLGKVVVNLNGHVLAGDASKAALTFSHPATSVTTPTQMTLAGPGRVAGAAGASSSVAAGQDGTSAIAVPAGCAAVAVEIGADVVVQGGDGGDSTVAAGHGAPAVSVADGASAVVTGAVADGVDGTLYSDDVAYAVLRAFPGATYERDAGTGELRVTLTRDVASAVLPDNLGLVTLDLNGFSVRGEDGTTSALSGAAIRITGTNPGENPTHLKIVGTGEIVGGRGATVSEYSPTTGYAGGTGVAIASSSIVLEIGADVTVRGGAGGNVSFNNTRVGGTGGSAVGVSSGAGDVTVLNAGRLVGGSGGENVLDADDYMGTGGYGVCAEYATRFVLVNDGEIAGGAGGTGGAGVYTKNGTTRNANNEVVAAQPGMCVTNNVGGVIRGGAGGQPGDVGGIGVDMYAADQTFVNLGVVVGGRGADANDDHPSGGAGGMGVRVGNNSYASSRFVNEGTVTGGDGGFGFLSGGPGGNASYWESSNKFCSLSGDGELLAGSLGGSRVSDVLVFQLPGVEATVDGNTLRLSLTNDLHGTFYVEPSLWGVTGAIEIDLNGHSIYGADGTAEHPDGWPAILVADDTYDYNGYGGLSIYDGTFSSNAVIRGGAGYPSSTSEPGGNGGTGHHADPLVETYYFTDGIHYYGGAGGSSQDGDGGDGGHGLWGFAGEWNGGAWLHGGDGGTSVNGDGGNGGNGILGNAEYVASGYSSESVGGDGGASENGMGGNGGNGVVYICADERDENEGFSVGEGIELVGGAGADGLFRGLGGSAQIYGDDPNQGGRELNGTGENDANGEDGRGRNWEFGVVGPGILDWNDLIDDPWLANTYIGETNAYFSVSIDGGEPIQVRYNDTDGQFLPEQIVFGGETDTVHHVAVVFHTSSTRITSVRPHGAIDEFVWNPYSIDIKEPVKHPESEPFTLANLGTVPAAEAKGRTLLCDVGIDTTANLDANGRQIDSMVNPAPADTATTGTMDYWYVAQNPRNPGDARDTLAMTAPTLSACEPTSFTVGGIEGLSEFSWEMLLREGGGASLTNGSLALTVVKTLDGVKTTNTYAYTAAELQNAWKGETFRFDGPTNAQYEVTFTYTNNSDGDGQALVDNIRWSPLGASPRVSAWSGSGRRAWRFPTVPPIRRRRTASG